MKTPSLIATIFFSVLATFAHAQITGPNPTYAGSTQVYTWNGSTLTSPNWMVVVNGTKISNSGNNVTVKWNAGVTSGTIVLIDAGVHKGTVSITLQSAPVPTAPTISPATSITATSFVANWGSSPVADSYQLDVSTSGSFDTFVTGYNNLLVNGTSQIVSGLTGGGTFYYRVRAVNSTGVSANSETSPPVEVYLRYPGNISVTPYSNSFSISWDAVPGATGYVLEVDEDENFTAPLFYSSAGGGTNRTVNGLTPSTNYWIRIKSYYGSTYSEYTSVIPQTTPAPAHIAGPTLVDKGSTHTYTWTGSPLSSPNWMFGNGTKVSNSGNSVTVTWSTTASGGAVILIAGGTHMATLNVSFIPTLDIPTNITITEHAFSLDLTWTAVPGANSYLLDVATDAAFENKVPGYAAVVINGTSTVVEGLNQNTTYWIRMKSSDGSTDSPYSNGIQKTTLDQFATVNENYIVSNTVLVSGVTTTGQINTIPREQISQTVQYFDGLGRPMQTVVTQGSPNKKDIVQPIAYDAFGREAVKYLPYISEEGNGWFKNNFVAKGATGYTTSDQYVFYNNASTTIAQDTKPYSETIFEPSPLSRPSKQYGAGEDWYFNDKHVDMEYLVNKHGTGDSNEEEKIIAWDLDENGLPIRHVAVTNHIVSGGYFDNGQLFVNVTKDEAGNAVREYKNKLGQVILKKVQVTDEGASNLNDVTGSNPGWALTYYIYDDFGNLAYVFQPELSRQIHEGSDVTPISDLQFTNLAFQYKYDGRMRMTHKKIPGADWVYLVYDKRDRLVLTQDGNQRTKDTIEWTFTKYDVKNRPILTGIYKDEEGFDQQQMQDEVNLFYSTNPYYEEFIGAEPGNIHGYSNQSFPNIPDSANYLTATYFDTYQFRDELIADSRFDFVEDVLENQKNAFYRVIGQITGKKVNVLSTSDYLWSVNYYDDRYRTIQSFMQNRDGEVDFYTHVYDFVGNLLNSKLTKQDQGIIKKYTYDHASRLLNTSYKVNDQQEVIISSLEYNELGQPVKKKLHSVDEGSTFQQHVDFDYNIRGWLTRINNADLSSDDSNAPKDYFGLELGYNNDLGVGTFKPQFNGNISASKWSANLGLVSIDQPSQRAFTYEYDPMNRFKKSNFSVMIFGGWAPTNAYVEDVSYDLNGNILTLNRSDENASFMDRLFYNYGEGENKSNRLLSVLDVGILTRGFIDGNTDENDYDHDANGNMIKDRNKAIDQLTYNSYLNLTEEIVKENGERIKNIYDAEGIKLAQEVFAPNSEIPVQVTDYRGEFIYQNDTLSSILHDEGQIIVPRVGGTGSLEYQYQIKDHLNNIRLTFTSKQRKTQFMATMEDSGVADFTNPRVQEMAYFGNLFETEIRNVNQWLNHTSNQQGNAIYLDGTTDKRVGPYTILKVFPGDTVRMEVFGKYEQRETHNTLPVASILASLLAPTSAAFNLEAGGLGSGFTDALSPFLFGKNADESRPAADLNYILFDKDLNVITFDYDRIEESAGFAPASENTVGFDKLELETIIDRVGYLYVYVSNESEGSRVWMDDLTINYHHSPIVQAEDYYPFGLTMTGTAFQHGNENYKGMVTTEGIGLKDLGFRQYDPALGRFHAVDVLSELQFDNSSYQYAGNNPIQNTDVLGLLPDWLKNFLNKFKSHAKEKNGYSMFKGFKGFFTKKPGNKKPKPKQPTSTSPRNNNTSAKDYGEKRNLVGKVSLNENSDKDEKPSAFGPVMPKKDKDLNKPTGGLVNSLLNGQDDGGITNGFSTNSNEKKSDIPNPLIQEYNRLFKVSNASSEVEHPKITLTEKRALDQLKALTKPDNQLTSRVKLMSASLNNEGTTYDDILYQDRKPPKTSTPAEALAEIPANGTLAQSTHFPNVDPNDFLDQLRARVAEGGHEGTNQGDETNFCWAAAIAKHAYEKDPKGMAEAMINLYENGTFVYDNNNGGMSVPEPSQAVKNAVGSNVFDNNQNEDEGKTINELDQMLFMTLADHYKGYTNADLNYDPHDEENPLWSGGVLSKAVRVWREFGFDVDVMGIDAVGWEPLTSKITLAKDALETSDVVLFVNSGAFKDGSYLNVFGTHYIHVSSIEQISDNDPMTIDRIEVKYWDYGGVHTKQMYPEQFHRSVYGIIQIPKIND